MYTRKQLWYNQMHYIIDPLAQLRPDLNGLTLLQINPDVAIDLRRESETVGWTFIKDGTKWIKYRLLDSNELDNAQDQLADMAILDAKGSENETHKQPPSGQSSPT